MSEILPEPILKLPQVNIPLDGVKGYLCQGENEQIIFMEFEKEIYVPEHAHESQWEVIIKGKVDLTVEGKKRTYKKGDSFYIPKDVKHSAKVYAGYTSVVFFNQKQRYSKK